MYPYNQESRKEKDLDARRADLQREIEALQNELGDENTDNILQSHIKLLHDYNEAKDATQVILGRLAVRKETTVRQLHEDYGLTATD